MNTLIGDIDVKEKEGNSLLNQRSCESKKQQKIKETSPWIDILEDLLRLIMKKLPFSDQVRSNVVCKEWHAKTKGIKATGSLPWAFYYEWNRSEASSKLTLNSKLLDPYNSQEFYHIKKEDCWEGLFYDARPCASSHGWLLFAKKEKRHTTTLLFAYSPFSNECISLPSLSHHVVDVVTFSKNPTSPNFLISFACPDKLYVGTYVFGEKNWNTQAIDADSQDPIFTVACNGEKGEFYCLSLQGNLSSFTVVDRSWRLLSKHARIVFSSFGFGKQRVMVERQGQLLLVLNTGVYMSDMFVFDWSAMEWVFPYGLPLSVPINSTRLCISTVKEDAVDSQRFYCSKVDNSNVVLYDYVVPDKYKLWIEPPCSIGRQ